MAYIQFALKDRPRATTLLLVNRVPFSCYHGAVFELPDSVLDRLTASGIAFERVQAPSNSVRDGVRASVQLIGSVAPTPAAKAPAP
ncbi:hypothetical protein HYR99_22955 [Candidatus Poribacteria bacterium]|nr:hypothetical protein [Candidatus Poribacteria bacterium]